jgi:transposase-like protein
MLDQKIQANFPKLTCSICGKTTRLWLPGVTARTRYTCPECCERISVGRGDQPRSANPFAPIVEPEVRQIALRYEIYRNSRTEMDDLN